MALSAVLHGKPLCLGTVLGVIAGLLVADADLLREGEITIVLDLVGAFDLGGLLEWGDDFFNKEQMFNLPSLAYWYVYEPCCINNAFQIVCYYS